MKCPKCGYLGFESTDRCRNCSYEFALAGAPAGLELSLRTAGDGDESLDDLSLVDAAAVPSLDRLQSQPSQTPVELPLFGPPIVGDRPLITRASAPRPPLAVRRSTPEVARARSESPRPATLDLSSDPEPGDQMSSSNPAGDRGTGEPWIQRYGGQDARLGARLAATLIDALVLLSIDAIVIYLTMQICGVTLSEFNLLPKGPLVAFLVVQNLGYLVAFTVGGQTLGKMAAGIRIVAADPDAPVDVGCAVKRTAAWLVLAVPAGLGFVTALFSPDHRGLHDRFAGTRVVRASA